jgi:hypothetical protein
MMIRALTPLNAITDAGAGLLLTHHPRMGDAAEGQAARGSGALPGFVDCIIELRRFAPGNRDDRRRVLTAYSRFDETAPEVVIELAADGRYRTCGSSSEAKREDRLAVILGLLTADAPGLTVGEILERWPEGDYIAPKPGTRTLETDLKSAHGVVRSGAGTRGDPYRFALGANPDHGTREP